MKRRVVAVVLAAGKSQRMGDFKQLLPYGGRTVIETVVDMLQSVPVEDIRVVVGHRADEVRGVLPESVRSVENAQYELGMFSSVLAALDSLEQDVEGMLLLLGDQPQIPVEVTRAVVRRFCESDKGIVIPQVGRERGHPVMIDIGRYSGVIRALDGSQGLKPVMRSNPEDTDIIEITDLTILRDMDTPEDYQRELRLRENE